LALLKRQGKKKGEEGYGRGRAAIAFDDDVLLDEEALVQALLGALEAPDYRPPTLPAVAVELLELSRLPDVDFDDVVRLLEQDSLIAGRVLNVARSPIYARAVEITSLHEALSRFGLRTLRDLVLEISMNLKVFKASDYTDTMDLLRRHSAMTAHLSKIVCNHSDVDGEYAFMAGLLHDVGIAGTLLALSERRGPKSGPPDLISVWPAVDRVHPRAGQLMAEHWGLSEDLQRVLSAHHQVLVEGEAHPLSATVCVADHLARELGHGLVLEAKEGDDDDFHLDCVRSHTNVDTSSPRTLEHAREALGIDEALLERIVAEAEGLDGKL